MIMAKWNKFHESIFGVGNAIKWFGAKGILKINNDVNAEVIASSSGTADHFTQYVVRIISKTAGELSQNAFPFKDYLVLKPGSRQNSNGFEVIGYCCKENIEWYIQIPTNDSLEEFNKDIFEYIQQWN